MTILLNLSSMLRPLPLAVATLILAACGGADQAAKPTQASQAEPDRARALALAPGAKDPDHHEFEATLSAPFTSSVASGARDFTLQFSYPGATPGEVLAYDLKLVDEAGKLIQQWQGETLYAGKTTALSLTWAGRAGAQAKLADGHYRVELNAAALDAERAAAIKAGPGRVAALLAADSAQTAHGQSWQIELGNPAKPVMPTFQAMRVGSDPVGRARAMAAPAADTLPYTVYYANLHSQTNDSDGGGALSSCASSQAAQTGEYGPATAFAYGKSAGLDILMSSEHNHYFDGSSSTNTSGSSAVAKARYQAGLSAATSASTANYLAIYGMEWGVISNGGHMNIFNSNELFSWEYNSANELFGDRLTPKSDYPAIYAVMRQQGLIGQFNHPDTSGQFLVGADSLGYSADGDEVMVLAEVMNTSAFSNNDTETETGRSNFEAAFNKMLERGFHVAPASNQDNHCANWGRSYTNRTAVLIPTGAALNKTSFLDALKARRVFATMDKNSQLVLSANGHLMGERFANSAALNLKVSFTNSAGRTAATVQILEGVPGRNGTVTTLASSATVTTTPTEGQHFYYAKVTQDDGKVLWSAPIWVTQSAGSGGGTPGDTTAPTATASVSGTGGVLTLSATASDNVGVARVDFVIDNVVKGTDSTAPYSISFDSTSLTDGAHSLVARAYDAAGNNGVSTAVAFSVSNGAAATLNETESNGSVATANVVTGQTTISGTMSSTSDKDFFRVSLSAAQNLRVDMTGPSGKDYDLYVVDASGTVLARSEGSTATESLTYANGASAQQVYIKVVAYSGSSTTLRYTLSLSYP
jgi:hypothetical protein